MRKILKTRYFDRWMRKTELSDVALNLAIREMEQGLVDADLGGGILKKRVALPGRGKSAGSRTLVATNRGNRWFFVFGFEKSERANISPKELAALQLIAVDLLKLSIVEIDVEVKSGALQEVCDDSKEESK